MKPANRHRRRLAVAAAAGLLTLPLAACSSSGGQADNPDTGQPAPMLVYISALDDHQLHAYDAVPLHYRPGTDVTAQAPTDTLAWAYDHTGGWVKITLVDDPDRRGWIGDYHLRGQLHLVDPDAPGCPVPAGDQPGRTSEHLDPSTRVRLVNLARHNHTTWIRVHDLHTDTSWWVEQHILSERAGPDIRRYDPGTPCQDIPPFTPAPHSH